MAHTRARPLTVLSTKPYGLSVRTAAIAVSTEASGAIYGVRTLEALRDAGVETPLIITRWAAETIRVETDGPSP